MTEQKDDNARYKAKMAHRKAVQDAEVASKTIEKGLLMVHTGTGKGKIYGRLRTCAPHDRPRPQGRRGAVYQGRLVDRREDRAQRHGARHGRVARAGRRLHLGERRTRNGTSRRAGQPGKLPSR